MEKDGGTQHKPLKAKFFSKYMETIEILTPYTKMSTGILYLHITNSHHVRSHMHRNI